MAISDNAQRPHEGMGGIKDANTGYIATHFSRASARGPSPEWASKGIIAYQPPRVGKAFGARVPAVDADGNERAGVRLPEIEVPLGSQTGWNFRHPDTGAADELAPVIGAYFPFPPTRAAREASGDPRRSIEERYRDKNDYLGQITAATLRLVRERYLLAGDLPAVIERAAAHYDWATQEFTVDATILGGEVVFER